MRVAVLTNNSSLFGKKLLNEFLANQIPLAQVIVIKQPVDYYLKLFSYVRKRVGVVDAVLFSVRRVLQPRAAPAMWRERPFIQQYEAMGLPFAFTDGTNSARTLELLEECKPDLLILGQTGIVRKRVLAIPARGTLNAHPGILPDYRGIDCERWAIHQRDFDSIGCSVHWVDAGVDTGSILTIQRYTLAPHETLESLDENLENLTVRTLVQTVVSITSGDPLDAQPQSRENGKQYYKMSIKDERTVKQILAERAATG
jgi:methionyl-tRNA formyltransferase